MNVAYIKYLVNLVFSLFILLSIAACSSNENTKKAGDFTDKINMTEDSPARFAIDDMAFSGAFRLTGGRFGDSHVNYAVGTLAYNPENHSLFIVGHAHHNAIAEYPIVNSGMQTVVADLPESGEPLQNFVSVLDAINNNPESINRITGMLLVNGSLIVNAEDWYDAGANNIDTTLVVVDANNLAGTTNGFFQLSGAANSAGYMGKIPDYWQQDFAAQYYTGWSSVYSINGRYSQGPSLWSFDPISLLSNLTGNDTAINATAHMNYSFRDGIYLDQRAVEYESQGVPGPFPPASPIWNNLSQGMYGFFVPDTRTFAVIGSTGGLNTGIGYKAVQEDGSVCPGPCPYGVNDQHNYYWLFDVQEILNASHVFDPQPYAYGVLNLPFDDNGHNRIIGASLDAEKKVLYVALDNAGQIGRFDKAPLILTYQLADSGGI